MRIKKYSSKKYRPKPKQSNILTSSFDFKKWGIRIVKMGIITFILLFIYAIIFLPSVKNAEQLNFAESTIIYDRGALEEGAIKSQHILYKIHGDENREYIPLKEISPYVPMATIAIEDDGFYHHFGFDIGGIIKAILNRVFGIGSARGGSTITQQLVKQVFLSSEKTFTRKFNELLLSIKVEFVYTKDEILELYLNKISYGNNSYGIEAAAQNYFGKSARDLTLAEASILASIPQAPSRYNPYGSNRDLLMGYYDYKEYIPQLEAISEKKSEIKSPLAKGDLEDTLEDKEDENKNKLRVYKKGRKDLVLKRLLDLGEITPDQFYQAWDEANFKEFKRNRTDIKAPHFVFLVKEQLEEKYGKEFLLQGGLQIYTTLDPGLQEIAQSVIDKRTASYGTIYGATNAAMTSINPETGEILAYIGGRDFFDKENDGQVDVLRSRRQPGSSFKPLVYATGFGKGFSPARVVFDVETDFGNGYKPQNFDEKFHGPVSFRKALNHSLNVPAIKMAFLATPKSILELAQKLGIKYKGDENTHGVAIGVGVAEVEPLSHINSFQAFMGDGSYHTPTSILEIRDANGKTLEKFDSKKTRKEGLEPEIAALIRNVLTDEKSRPSSWNNLLNLEVYNSGAKTGTSNKVKINPKFNKEIPESKDNKKFITVPGDSWTIGFTPHLLTGVWVGNNRGQPLKSGATGLTVAAPIWKNFMLEAHDLLIKRGADPKKDYVEFELVKKTVDKYSGLLAKKDTPQELLKNEYFAPSAVQTRFDNAFLPKSINILTGEESDDNTPEWAEKEVQVLNLKPIRPDLSNWITPVKKWQKEHPIIITETGEVIYQDEDWEIPESFLAELPESLQAKIKEKIASEETVDWTQLVKDENAPKIKIISPQKTISTGRILVQVQIDRPSEVEAVDFFLDGDFIYKSKHAPFTGSFAVSADHEIGSKHTIEVQIVGENFASNSDKIEVEIANDKTPPFVRIISPQANQKFSMGSQIEIYADIQDTQSGIASVEFFLNQKSLGKLSEPPFKRMITLPNQKGRQNITINALDSSGNFSNKSIPIHTTKEQLIRIKTPQISEIKQQRDSVLVKLVFPNYKKIQSAKIIMAQPEKILFEKNLYGISKFMQIVIPKEKFRGSAGIDLYTQKKGTLKPEKSDSKTIKF